jgi:D-alanyl-D-alanine carboxypeptidase
MMLPSGNDAAFLIAEVGGYLIQQGCSSNWESMSSTIENKQGAFAGIFLREMNSIAQRLGMYGSNFANPHGLNNPQNFSCAEDLARLCAYAMKNHQFRKIVQTRKYEYKPIRQNSTNMK